MHFIYIFLVSIVIASGTTVTELSAAETSAEESLLDPALADSIYGSIPRRADLRTSLASMIGNLNNHMITEYLTFPHVSFIDEEVRMVAKGSLFSDIDTSVAIARSVNRRVRKRISSEMANSPSLNDWRRAVGLLAASLINNAAKMSPEVRQDGLILIQKFVDFVEGWNIDNSRFISPERLKQFLEVIQVVSTEFAAMAESVSVPSVSDKEHSDGLVESVLDQVHAPKHCALCHALRENPSTTIAELVEMVSVNVEQKAFSKRYDCKKFFHHVESLIDFFMIATPHDLTKVVEPFCEQSASNLLRYLSRCAATRGLKSNVLASKLGHACGTKLPLATRLVVLPSMLLTSLTPIEEEGLVAVDEETDQELFPELIVRSSDKEIVLADSFNQLRAFNRFTFEVPLSVSFEGSLASGSGSRKEWINVIWPELFLPVVGLFEYSDKRAQYMRPVALDPATALPEQLMRYRQVGRLLGISARDKLTPAISLTPGAVHFLRGSHAAPISDKEDEPKALMKMLMQEDPDVATGLKNLRRVDPTDIEGAALTFEGLVDGGENIPVTSANVEEYVNRNVRHLVLDKIEPQMTAMAAGVYDVLPLGMWSFLTVEELSDLIRGTKEIDIADLKKATSYSPKSTKDDIIVEWFWEIVGGFSDTENEDFLRFVSGSPFPPMHGFSGITGTQTWFQIVIESGLYVDQVPIAQTCFAQLRMPRYTSRDIMRTRLLTAFENAKSLENA